MTLFELLKRKVFHGGLAPLVWIWVQDSAGKYLYDANGVKIVMGVRTNG